MAEYIEREALLSELQEEIDFETSMYTEEQNKYFKMGLKCAARDVKSQPTADVVPKSEVYEIQAELSHYKTANLRQSLIIGQMDLTHKQFLKELDEIFKEHKDGFCCDWYLYEKYAELKKKYTENENG